MGFDVTDYHAITGRQTGDFELDVERPEPRPNTIRKLRDHRTDEVTWLLPNGAITRLKPRIVR